MKMLNCNNEILIKQFKNLINKFFIMKALNAISTGITLLAFMMSSCTADEQISVNTQEDAITFSVNTESQTRSVIPYSGTNMPKSFYVWADFPITTGEGENAVTSKQLYINKDKVNRKNNGYVAEKTRYWPSAAESMNFYAYVDDDNTFNYNNGAPQFVDFVVNEDVSKQHDLLYAINNDFVKANNGSAIIPLEFHHALCQVFFMGVNQSKSLRFTIHKVEVYGVTDKGTFNFPKSSNEKVGLENWILPVEGEHILKNYTIDGLNVVLEPGEYEHITGPIEKADGTLDWSRVLTVIPQHQDVATKRKWLGDEHLYYYEEYFDGAWFKIWMSIENKAGDSYTKIVDNKAYPFYYEYNWKPGRRYIWAIALNDTYIEDVPQISYTATLKDYDEKYYGQPDD